jgi:hypothetical protein
MVSIALLFNPYLYSVGLAHDYVSGLKLQWAPKQHNIRVRFNKYPIKLFFSRYAQTLLQILIYFHFYIFSKAILLNYHCDPVCNR